MFVSSQFIYEMLFQKYFPDQKFYNPKHKLEEIPDQAWDALRDLVPFVQFKKVKKNPWRSVTFSTKSNTSS